ncbi:MAG: nuclear transport factor 2 family protein [Acidobacteriaceae bacterium]|jgi:ketosteroid isomerase-like protein|nr:nuclear transport factor 2 family protein [Acidobacteriaceae bacterium]
MSDVDAIIALERAVLDRWGAGDPRGYLEIMAPAVTYFDPFQEQRVDGLTAMTDLFAPWTGKIQVDCYDMVRPNVQQHGDAALLTFNLVSYRRRPDGTTHPIAHWNCSELYARFNGAWRIAHSHWSFVKPELKQTITEEA